MNRLWNVLPMWSTGTLLLLWGWGAYRAKRLAYRGALITGKRATSRGVLLALWGLAELVAPILFLGGYVSEIDMIYITLVAEPIAFLIGFVLLLIFYRPQE